MGAINQVLEQAVNAALQVTQNTALSLPADLIDRVKLLALIDALNALDYAMSHADEAKMLNQPEDAAYRKEVLCNYAKSQVEIQVNLNAMKADVKEVA
jgi:hypothetical protein